MSESVRMIDLGDCTLQIGDIGRFQLSNVSMECPDGSRLKLQHPWGKARRRSLPSWGLEMRLADISFLNQLVALGLDKVGICFPPKTTYRPQWPGIFPPVDVTCSLYQHLDMLEHGEIRHHSFTAFASRHKIFSTSVNFPFDIREHIIGSEAKS